MDNNLEYANEKLVVGVLILATHKGAIKERLIAAFCDSLVSVPVDALPDDPKQIWQEVWATVTANKGTEESGAFLLSINDLTEDEAGDLARKITTVESMVGASLR